MKVLFIGLGSIGRRNLDSCRRVRPQYTYAALRHAPGEPSGIQEFHQISEVAEFKPDLVWVCTPTHLHWETLKSILPFQPAVYLEKPVAHRVSDIQEIARAVSANGRPFFYGCVLRKHPLLNAAREIREFGKPLSYQITCGSYLPDWRPGRDYRTTYSAKTEEGGGAALDLIHEFDYAEYLFGPIREIQGFKTNVSSIEISSEDLCVTTNLHTSGVIGQVHLDYFRKTYRRDFEIQFEKGWVQGDLLTGRLTPSSGEERTLKADRDYLHDHQSTEVFETLEKGLSSPWNISDVARLTEQVIQIRRLAR